MNAIKAIFCTLVGLLAPIYMMPFVFFIRWDDEPSTVSGNLDDSFIVRGDLPSCLQWAQTMDMRFPGGIYEPAIKAAYGDGRYWRKLWASYIWAGHRNRAHGLAYHFGKPAEYWIDDYFDAGAPKTYWTDVGGVLYYERNAISQCIRTFGKILLITGLNVYRLQDGKFWAVPVCTIKFKRGK